MPQVLALDSRHVDQQRDGAIGDRRRTELPYLAPPPDDVSAAAPRTADRLFLHTQPHNDAPLAEANRAMFIAANAKSRIQYLMGHVDLQ